MERREGRELSQSGHHLLVDHDRLDEPRSAVHDAVPHGVALGEAVDGPGLVPLDEVQLQRCRAGVDDEHAVKGHTSPVHALGVCLIILAAGAPWIAGIAYFWRRLPRGDAGTPSFGEYLRQRASIR